MKRKKGPAEGSAEGSAPEKAEAPKKKEQKIIYIDDGSTIADMSGTYKTRDGKAPPAPPSARRCRPFSPS